MDRTPFTDQIGREVIIPVTPCRIISLVPSITELLFSLGMGNNVVGVTRFCVHPEEARQRARNIGGTKKINLDRIEALNPDLIIGNKEENTSEDIKALEQDYPVWISDVQTVSEGIEMIRQIGVICGKSKLASEIAHRIECGFKDLSNERILNRPKVAYLIWYDPIMVSGKRNFINSVIEQCGWKNVFEEFESTGNERYPEVTINQLRAQKPAVIFLSTEPYPFKENHVQQFREAVSGCEVKLVDGEMFSWYGSRMLKMPAYFQQLRTEIERRS